MPSTPSDSKRHTPNSSQDTYKSIRSRHEQMVSWMRKTEYISTEIYTKWNKGDKVESRLGYNLKRKMTDDNIYRDRESQIAAIEKTFEASKIPITEHYSKPDVHAVEVLPVMPDFTLWRYPCAQVIFDDNPARKELSVSQQREEANQAMIRGMVDETGDHFVAYFLPTEETKAQRRLDVEQGYPFTEGANYEYELAREYNWNVKNKTMSNYEKNYFFVFRKDGVFYNELETRVRLSKRRKLNSSALAGSSRFPTQQSSTNKTRLIVSHRDFTEDEIKAQTDRLYMLEHDVEEEDEEEELEEDNQADGEGEVEAEEEENEDKREENSEAESSVSSNNYEKLPVKEEVSSKPSRKTAKQFVFSSDSEEEEEEEGERRSPPEVQGQASKCDSGEESSDLSDL